MFKWLKRLFTETKDVKYWQRHASRIGGAGYGDCKHSTARISRKMQEAKWSHFICHGTYRGRPHRWIQAMDGTIIDGVQILTDKIFYDIHRDDTEFIKGD